MQRYLENSPLIVLGSGASMPYGLPSMGKLVEQIKSNDVVKADPSYNAFCASLSSEGLEKAIDSVSLNKETINAIRTTIWKNVNDNNRLAPGARSAGAADGAVRHRSTPTRRLAHPR